MNSSSHTIQRHTSDSPWETQVAYCRIVQAGPHIWIAGTAPVDPQGCVVAPGDAYAQAAYCLKRILDALHRAGADARHVVRTRMFVTNIDAWEAIGKAHQEVFAKSPPAATMVEVQRLIDPAMLVEIEADAFVH